MGEKREGALAAASGEPAGDPRVRFVYVRTGRHVDYVEFRFEDGRRKAYGDPKGGEPCTPLELDVKSREYIVRIKGRQNKMLDGVQFVTNLGRESKWYGGGGGEPFQLRAPAGEMIVGLGMGESDFCPRIESLETSQAILPPPRISLLRLVAHPNVRRLVFGGNPSLFHAARMGRPSVLWLLLRKRMILFRVMWRGNPSFLRLVLDGEQQREPMSLFRKLCTAPEAAELSAMQMMSCRDPKDRASKSLTQLLLMGSPSVARQFFGKSTSKLTPLVQLLFDRDIVNGYPSLTHLLTIRDTFDGVEHPSVFEAVLEGEQYVGRKMDPGVRRVLSLGMHGSSGDAGDVDDGAPAYPMSLMRLMLQGEPSLFSLMMEGEREGQPSILRRYVEARTENGLSLARMALTNFENHKGHRPALSTYIFGGEHMGRPSLLRMLIAGEARPDQHSLMRLLFFKYKPTRPGLLRSASSFRKRTGAAGNAAPPKERRSLMDLLTAGKPSIADLFFQGELEGEDSLARLMLGTCVDFSDGYLRLGATLKAGNENGVSLMQWMLIGEEDGGPGISFIRMLLFGEEDNGFSILRLMLMNESTAEPSMLRILLTTLKALLLAARTRPHQLRNGEWKSTVNKIASSVLASQKEGASLRAQAERLAESLNPNGEQFKLLLSALRTIPKRGNEFQGLWKTQWERVAKEVDKAGKRARSGTVWSRMAPTWKRMAEHVGSQNWPGLASEVALLASDINALSHWTKRIKQVHAATPAWVLRNVLPASLASISRAEAPTDGASEAGDEEDDDDH